MTRLLRAGELTARELAEAHLDRIERQNHALNAWLSMDRESAITQADAADTRLAAARSDGDAAQAGLHPLLGVPIALKDLISVAGALARMPSTGSDGVT